MESDGSDCVYSRRFNSSLEWVNDRTERFLSNANWELDHINKTQGDEAVKSELVNKLFPGEKKNHLTMMASQ